MGKNEKCVAYCNCGLMSIHVVSGQCPCEMTVIDYLNVGLRLSEIRSHANTWRGICNTKLLLSMIFLPMNESRVGLLK